MIAAHVLEGRIPIKFDVNNTISTLPLRQAIEDDYDTSYYLYCF